MNTQTADLDTEVRRLHVRIIGLTSAQLAAPGERSTTSRRDSIAEALAEFSAIGSDGRAVPDLGDQSLADQVVVLIETGRRRAEMLDSASREQVLGRLLDAAADLRRRLA
ncbi:hypothetical protein [Brevibacterium casei]|uniref:hypothetical protein n=1 Tax=Brevibacterium casei TaxID=33889 RepID=UPI000E649DE7|nr:hypothetical protein [Brevibacterium casei]